jgi:hypothetical protein
MKSRKKGQIFMTGVAQHQPDGSFQVKAWNPSILWVDNLALRIDGRAICYLQEPIHMD